MSYLSLCNNGIYSFIELLDKFTQNFAPYIPEILKKLDSIIDNPKINKSLLLNWAIFFGQICGNYPEYVGQY